MAVVFSLIDDKDKCDGCALKIKRCVKKLQGVASAELKKSVDENGNNDFSLLVKGRFDPKKIIKEIEKNKRKRIKLVSGGINNCKPKPVKVNDDGLLEKLKHLANSTLLKATWAKLYYFISLVFSFFLLSVLFLETGHKKIFGFLLFVFVFVFVCLGLELMELENECETLVTQLNIDGPKQNKLARQKQETLNRNLPNVSIPKISRGAGVGAV